MSVRAPGHETPEQTIVEAFGFRKDSLRRGSRTEGGSAEPKAAISESRKKAPTSLGDPIRNSVSQDTPFRAQAAPHAFRIGPERGSNRCGSTGAATACNGTCSPAAKSLASAKAPPSGAYSSNQTDTRLINHPSLRDGRLRHSRPRLVRGLPDATLHRDSRSAILTSVTSNFRVAQTSVGSAHDRARVYGKQRRCRYESWKTENDRNIIIYI
jgi:hypothetical protein